MRVRLEFDPETEGDEIALSLNGSRFKLALSQVYDWVIYDDQPITRESVMLKFDEALETYDVEHFFK